MALYWKDRLHSKLPQADTPGKQPKKWYLKLELGVYGIDPRKWPDCNAKADVRFHLRPRLITRGKHINSA